MVVTEQDKELVQRMGEAMQAGEPGKEALIGLFADDAVFIEPFGGAPTTHTGIDAIRERITEMVAQPRPPDFKLQVDRVDIENGELVSYWTCTSAVMPGPMKGRDELKIRDGKMTYLKIQVLGMPS